MLKSLINARLELNMKNKFPLFIILCLIIIFSLFFTYFYFVTTSKIKSLDNQLNVLANQKKEFHPDQPKSAFEIISNEEKVVQALTDDRVKEEVKYIENYNNWPIYTSKMGIKFRYPQGLGCGGDPLWRIKEDDTRISIFDCNGFSGEFDDTPAYEIRKISGQEAKKRGKEEAIYEHCDKINNPDEYICNELFGNLYDDKEGYGGWSKYLLNRVHTSTKGVFTYFKFVMHKLDDYPVAVKKIIGSIELVNDNQE